MALGLYNRLNWNLAFRGDYKAATGDAIGDYLKPEPIPPIEISLKSPLVAIGIGSTKAKASWYKGGWASLILPFTPSSTGQFPAKVDPAKDRHVLRLGYYTLLDFTYWGLANYSVQIKFPYYFKDVGVEVWEYSESVEGVFRPPSTDPYSQAEDLKAIRAFLENKEFDVTLQNSNG